jgi:hypothetical protein
MQTSMSKHDQVLVIGNSRFGRVKIPSCIACDRPLLNKVRQENASNFVQIPRSETSNLKPVNMMKTPVISDRDVDLQESSVSTIRTTGSGRSLKSGSIPSLSIMKNQGAPKMVQSQSQYIMRSGFKMPKSSLAPNSTGEDESVADSGSLSLPELHP